MAAVIGVAAVIAMAALMALATVAGTVAPLPFLQRPRPAFHVYVA